MLIIIDFLRPLCLYVLQNKVIEKYSLIYCKFFFFSLLALQPLSGVVFYSPLAGFSLLDCEVS